MKIDRVSTFIVGNPWKNWVIVKVDTDEGVSGLGEATGITSAPMAAEAKEVARFVMGMDPREPLRVADALDKGTNLSIKPANCAMAPRDKLRASGELPMLEAGGSRSFEVEVGVLEGSEELERFAGAVDRCRPR